MRPNPGGGDGPRPQRPGPSGASSFELTVQFDPTTGLVSGTAGSNSIPSDSVSSVPAAAPLLGTVGYSTDNKLIYGPFEAGFGQGPTVTAFDDTQPPFPCEDDDDVYSGYCPGGMDVGTCEEQLYETCPQGSVRDELFMDRCGGHANPYHYHTDMLCSYDPDAAGHSPAVGVMLDGRVLYGRHESTGTAPTDLDPCGGHVGPVPARTEWNIPEGTEVYHYHARTKPPYLLGCFGPVDDLDACKALYDPQNERQNRGCDAAPSSEPLAANYAVEYDLWCPCFPEDTPAPNLPPRAVDDDVVGDDDDDDDDDRRPDGSRGGSSNDDAGSIRDRARPTRGPGDDPSDFKEDLEQFAEETSEALEEKKRERDSKKQAAEDKRGEARERRMDADATRESARQARDDMLATITDERIKAKLRVASENAISGVRQKKLSASVTAASEDDACARIPLDETQGACVAELTPGDRRRLTQAASTYDVTFYLAPDADEMAVSSATASLESSGIAVTEAEEDPIALLQAENLDVTTFQAEVLAAASALAQAEALDAEADALEAEATELDADADELESELDEALDEVESLDDEEDGDGDGDANNGLRLSGATRSVPVAGAFVAGLFLAALV
jgi:hypothetical protein